MKRLKYDMDADDLEIYEPVNSKYREQMFMKWRMEERSHDYCDNKCKGHVRKNAKKKHQLDASLLWS
jgi:hypothetical protein